MSRVCSRSATTFHTRLLFPATGHGRRSSAIPICAKLATSSQTGLGMPKSPRGIRGSARETPRGRVLQPNFGQNGFDAPDKIHEYRPSKFSNKIQLFVQILPSIALFRRHPLFQKLQRIERSHHGPRKIKPRGQGLAPVGLDTGKPLFRLAEEAFDRHRGGRRSAVRRACKFAGTQ